MSTEALTTHLLQRKQVACSSSTMQCYIIAMIFRDSEDVELYLSGVIRKRIDCSDVLDRLSIHLLVLVNDSFVNLKMIEV